MKRYQLESEEEKQTQSQLSHHVDLKNKEEISIEISNTSDLEESQEEIIHQKMMAVLPHFYFNPVHINIFGITQLLINKKFSLKIGSYFKLIQVNLET